MAGEKRHYSKFSEFMLQKLPWVSIRRNFLDEQDLGEFKTNCDLLFLARRQALFHN